MIGSLENHKQYYEKNKDEIAEKRKQWYETNKNKITEKTKQRYETNKDETLQHQKQYRLKYKENFNCECGGKYTRLHKSTRKKQKAPNLFKITISQQ